MAEKNDLPRVVVKRKNIQVVVDYCLDESIEFAVKQQNFPDTDWVVEMNITDIKSAILTGMFLKENRFDLEGMDAQKMKKPAPKKTTSTKSSDKEDTDTTDEVASETADTIVEEKTEVSTPSLNF